MSVACGALLRSMRGAIPVELQLGQRPRDEPPDMAVYFSASDDNRPMFDD